MNLLPFTFTGRLCGSSVNSFCFFFFIFFKYIYLGSFQAKEHIQSNIFHFSISVGSLAPPGGLTEAVPYMFVI